MNSPNLPGRRDLLADEAARLARAIEQLGARPRADPAEPAAEPGPLAGMARRIIARRRLRDQFLGPELFGEPAWDILLDLFAAGEEGKAIHVTSCCIAAAVPQATASRWIKRLKEVGLVLERPDPKDGRRFYLFLSDAARTAMAAYLSAARDRHPF